MSTINAEALVDDIISELEGRGGFDHWWDGIDSDIQDEIRQTLVFIVENQ